MTASQFQGKACPVHFIMLERDATPSIGWFFKSAQHRRVAWQYWVNDTILGFVYLAFHYVFRLAPTDTCSSIGSAIGSFARNHIRFDIGEFRRSGRDEARARQNWAWLRPTDNSPATVEAVMEQAYRQGAQTYLEFSVLHRLWPEGRIAVEGAEHLAAARATGCCTLVVGVHVGNWETIGPALIGLGHKTTIVYQKPINRFDHRMAVAARRRYGAALVPPGRAGGRIAYRALADASGVLLLYIDEFVNGRVYAPFFGRPAMLEGNIANAARLAAMTDAIVIPVYCTRLDGARFKVTFMPPVDIERTADSQADLAANVAKLNATIEPIVRTHLEQWLWLFDIRADR
ncbi:MAG: lysophospholipid acyltransferase family protein [Pseudolabrys sp.]|nr:lysophospholipid acyltransferase family protein [Pseudolabrys sp.]MDP2295232.1 lysophospholipid acyltransferase family protein [Pseudolabrys sp.]